MAEQSQSEATIPHGEEIVERFGGIRPMAAKLEVPVTTVQGWKKRDAIPVSRRDDIINAANQYNISLKGLVSSESVANQNARIEEDPALRIASSQPQTQAQTARMQPAASVSSRGDHTDLRQIRRSARTTSLITSASLCILLAGAGFLLFGGETHQQNNTLNSLQTRVSDLESRVPAANGLPAGLDATISNLQGQVQAITSAIGAGEISASGATIMQRLSALELQLASNPGLQGVVENLQGMTATQGATSLQSAVEELRSVVAGLQGRMDGFDVALNQARAQNESLASALNGVTGRDVSAAAMLLALTQLRYAVDRQAPFEQDLALLRQVAVATDPELAASVDRMAPYAETGVLSAHGLKNELAALSNDIITAKLAGEDISFKDRVLSRLQGLFTLKKDGVPVSGSEERALIAQANVQLNNNDVAGAIATLQQLQGPAAQAASPWQSQAAATLAVQSIDRQIVNALMNKVRGLSGRAPIDLSPAVPRVVTPQPQLQPELQVEPQAGEPVPESTPQPTVTIEQ